MGRCEGTVTRSPCKTKQLLLCPAHTLLRRGRGGALPARRGRRVALLHGIATPGSSGQESLCARACVRIGTCLTQRERSLPKLSKPLAAGKTSVPLKGIYRCVCVCVHVHESGSA